MELFIFARFHAREGREDAIAAALREEVEASQTDPGYLAHQAYHSTRDPGLFFIHSRWTDEAAFESHIRMPHTVRFVKRVQPSLDHEFEVNRAQLLEAK